MKVVGWRHKTIIHCVWLAVTKEVADEMLKAGLEVLNIPWKDRHECFEEIEAEITYNEVT